MDCEHAKKIMAQMLDGEPPTVALMQELLAHTQGCASCRALYKRYQRLQKGYQILAAEEPPSEFSKAWRERLRYRKISARRALAMAASLVLVAGLGMFGWHALGMGAPASGANGVSATDSGVMAFGADGTNPVTEAGGVTEADAPAAQGAGGLATQAPVAAQAAIEPFAAPAALAEPAEPAPPAASVEPAAPAAPAPRTRMAALMGEADGDGESESSGDEASPTSIVTPAPEPTSNVTPSPKPTAAPAVKSTPTAAPSPKPTAALTPTPKPTATVKPTPKPTPTATAAPTPKPTAALTPTPKPSPTVKPTPKPTPTATAAPSPAPPGETSTPVRRTYRISLSKPQRDSVVSYLRSIGGSSASFERDLRVSIGEMSSSVSLNVTAAERSAFASYLESNQIGQAEGETTLRVTLVVYEQGE